jgi:hypothetical protein
MKLEFSRQTFEEISNIKFNQNPSQVGVELFQADERTDGLDEANNHFSQFYKRT